jgi:hypothetical protein
MFDEQEYRPAGRFSRHGYRPDRGKDLVPGMPRQVLRYSLQNASLSPETLKRAFKLLLRIRTALQIKYSSRE